MFFRGWRLHPLVAAMVQDHKLLHLSDGGNQWQQDMAWYQTGHISFKKCLWPGMAFPRDFLKKKTTPTIWGCLKRFRIDVEAKLRFRKSPGDCLFMYLFVFFRKRCFKRFWEKNNVTMESMRCFYLDLCMWRICRSCLIRTRDSA